MVTHNRHLFSQIYTTFGSDHLFLTVSIATVENGMKVEFFTVIKCFKIILQKETVPDFRAYNINGRLLKQYRFFVISLRRRPDSV